MDQSETKLVAEPQIWAAVALNGKDEPTRSVERGTGDRAPGRCLKKEWAKDPIDYEQLDNIDFWIVEEDPPADIDYEELEKTLYEEEEEEQGSSSSSNKRPRVEEDFEYDLTDEIDFDISHLVDAMEMEMDSFIFED
ncbi:unnamed protein product [Linum tenue]|uniref:Uncharacterized protein n=1 Tax=Linum tenue TaxID=586396 RepID=A0AAV0I5K7_9ROSI|nr:unnamed protein product [Linum tenue]